MECQLQGIRLVNVVRLCWAYFRPPYYTHKRDAYHHLSIRLVSAPDGQAQPRGWVEYNGFVYHVWFYAAQLPLLPVVCPVLGHWGRLGAFSDFPFLFPCLPFPTVVFVLLNLPFLAALLHRSGYYPAISQLLTRAKCVFGLAALDLSSEHNHFVAEHITQPVLPTSFSGKSCLCGSTTKDGLSRCIAITSGWINKRGGATPQPYRKCAEPMNYAFAAESFGKCRAVVVRRQSYGTIHEGKPPKTCHTPHNHHYCSAASERHIPPWTQLNIASYTEQPYLHLDR
ncbi:hypothetical protein B0T20DRAFT_246543 [Sordaria brevicollis]|uniref:Uncharacterized protein n=1 Tax=Sordaria brevicollis TaxID=83679 RepID=A0AAE0PBT1_SORBR|nr:hypothetical protein B0T20DRAFT_246543 [Sordaria brevicollis]